MKKFLFMAVAAIGLLLGSCDNGDSGFTTGTHKIVVSVTGSSDVTFIYVVQSIESNGLSTVYVNGEYAGDIVDKTTTIGNGQNITFTSKSNALSMISALSVSGEEGEYANVTVKCYVDDKLTKEIEKSCDFTRSDFEESITISTAEL